MSRQMSWVLAGETGTPVSAKQHDGGRELKTGERGREAARRSILQGGRGPHELRLTDWLYINIRHLMSTASCLQKIKCHTSPCRSEHFHKHSVFYQRRSRRHNCGQCHYHHSRHDREPWSQVRETKIKTNASRKKAMLRPIAHDYTMNTSRLSRKYQPSLETLPQTILAHQSVISAILNELLI